MRSSNIWISIGRGGSDKTFYERFVDKVVCQLVSVSGKPSSKLRVIAVLGILEKSTFQGILAIIDADFERLETLTYSSPNLLRTDTHDLETMLINSQALNKVVAEFGSEEKIAQFSRDVRLALLETGMSVGYLRWLSQRNGMNLTFEGIRFSKFIDEQTLQIDELKLIREVKNKSQAFSLKDEDLQQQLMSQKNNSYDPWQICCGHDLVQLLSLGLRKAIGSNKVADVEPNSLERNLRLAYEEVYFWKTHLYVHIRTWESKNQPFRVLRNEV
ncbi:hypothetical protein WA1_36005 [Scytonema hofmannii PCC 7110]|uniref:DUF4435 domain-containing protein n=1 Tax=Scytonema hofmannii PCC 7110 TaxID=128403 RepID=A0A139X1Q1_9CYAN|nr:DUF4435 domain-containing protein [Scytonema hofmannii]KYC38590.1 hypothetical protein WA1_36005 [Scytonema hofmannii PCC 7110]